MMSLGGWEGQAWGSCSGHPWPCLLDAAQILPQTQSQVQAPVWPEIQYHSYIHGTAYLMRDHVICCAHTSFCNIMKLGMALETSLIVHILKFTGRGRNRNKLRYAHVQEKIAQGGIHSVCGS